VRRCRTKVAVTTAAVALLLMGGAPAVAAPFDGPANVGWSFGASRQLLGDVTGDGYDDVVTVHQAARGKILVFGHENCEQGDVTPGVNCLDTPAVWQDLRGGSWSYFDSQQFLADTDADGLEDLISIHRTPRGVGVYRHLSDGSSFAAPETLNHLVGWNFTWTRGSVADTWGELIV